MKSLSLFVVLASLALAPAVGHAADLRVRLTGFAETSGTVRVALFASAADFEAGRQMAGYFSVVRSGAVEAVFENLPPGRYGISTFHDKNANDELDANLVGIPTEPFGFSRNARGRFGPPSFDDLSVELGSEDVALEITLQ